VGGGRRGEKWIRTYALHGDNAILKRERANYQNTINYYQRRIKEIDKKLEEEKMTKCNCYKLNNERP
jgi:hypothetical protein